MRALIYARVSLDPRGQGRSIEEQTAESEAWAAREGWTVVERITETGSASRYATSTRARTQWSTLTTRLASGDIDILVTWEASRATRQLAEYAHLAELCARHGVLWGYSGTIHDLATREGSFRTGLDALLAQDESARNSERVQRSVRARVAAGAPHGKLPYGYRREYDPHTGALARQVPDESTAPIVTEIARRVLTGEPYYSIARDLTARGIPTPRPPITGRDPRWLSSTVKGIATNPTIAGLRTHKGIITGPATWPGIITPEQHEQILAITARHRDHAANLRGDSTARWLLTGIARCGHPDCGGRVRKIKARGYLAYNCAWCLRMSRSMTKVDTYVTERLLAILALIDTDTPDSDDRPDIRDARAAVDELKNRLDTFVEEAAAGRLTAASLSRIEARLLPQLDTARARLRALQVPPDLAAYDLTDPAALWDGLDIAARRDLLRAVVTVTLDPIGKGRHRDDPGAGITVRPNW